MPQDLELAQAFKNAIPHLSECRSERRHSDREKFICIAIKKGNPNMAIAKRARTVVMDRLEGHSTLFSWLRDKIDRDALIEDELKNDERQIQATRLAWLNSLVEEFS